MGKCLHLNIITTITKKHEKQDVTHLQGHVVSIHVCFVHASPAREIALQVTWYFVPCFNRNIITVTYCQKHEKQHVTHLQWHVVCQYMYMFCWCKCSWWNSITGDVVFLSTELWVCDLHLNRNEPVLIFRCLAIRCSTRSKSAYHVREMRGCDLRGKPNMLGLRAQMTHDRWSLHEPCHAWL